MSKWIDSLGLCAISAMIAWGLGSYYGRMAERDRAEEMARTVNDMRIEEYSELARCRDLQVAIEDILPQE